jgi:hypothetical protein
MESNVTVPSKGGLVLQEEKKAGATKIYLVKFYYFYFSSRI